MVEETNLFVAGFVSNAEEKTAQTKRQKQTVLPELNLCGAYETVLSSRHTATGEDFYISPDKIFKETFISRGYAKNFVKAILGDEIALENMEYQVASQVVNEDINSMSETRFQELSLELREPESVEVVSIGDKGIRTDVLIRTKGVLADFQEYQDVCTIDIEMQKSVNFEEIYKRAMYYFASLYAYEITPRDYTSTTVLETDLLQARSTSRNSVERRITLDYKKLRRIYSIWIMSSNIFNDTHPIHIFSPLCAMNKEAYDVYPKNIGQGNHVFGYLKEMNLMNIIFIELPKFSKMLDPAGSINELIDKRILDMIRPLIAPNKIKYEEALDKAGLSQKEVTTMTQYGVHAKTYAEAIEQLNMKAQEERAKAEEERAKAYAEERAKAEAKTIFKLLSKIGSSQKVIDLLDISKEELITTFNKYVNNKEVNITGITTLNM